MISRAFFSNALKWNTWIIIFGGSESRVDGTLMDSGMGGKLANPTYHTHHDGYLNCVKCKDVAIFIRKKKSIRSRTRTGINESLYYQNSGFRV